MYENIVYEICIRLVGDDKHNVARLAIVKLLENVQIVDMNAIMKPIAKNSTAKAIGAPKEVPVNYTLLGSYVSLPEKANAFNPSQSGTRTREGDAG